MTRKIYLLAVLSILLLACKPAKKLDQYTQTIDHSASAVNSKAKNIILLIGDGMGISQISASLYANDNQLNLEKFNNIGFHKTYSASNLITDSAAGASAFSIGRKTYNGAIGVDKDSISHQSILELAESKGLSTGLIATSTITHATPAAFIAHQKSRKMYEEIAADFLDTAIDLFIGGGMDHFDKRKDNRNLIVELKTKGYQIGSFHKETLSQISIDPNKNFGYFTDDSSPKPYSKGRRYLEEATSLALDYLSQKSDKGFFLMIEASQIDWGGHDNDINYVISEMLEFDRVVKIAYEFAQKDKETLIIVTGDHETGGLSIVGGSIGGLETSFNKKGHTADLIPVFSFGPGSDKFRGIYENTAIYSKMRQSYGWK